MYKLIFRLHAQDCEDKMQLIYTFLLWNNDFLLKYINLSESTFLSGTQ
jgi:hypothetical protein